MLKTQDSDTERDWPARDIARPERHLEDGYGLVFVGNG
jgi:hypothetical protein